MQASIPLLPGSCSLKAHPRWHSCMQVETEGDVATANTLARILSNVPPSRGGPTSLVIFDIHALQVRQHASIGVCMYEACSCITLVRAHASRWASWCHWGMHSCSCAPGAWHWMDALDRLQQQAHCFLEPHRVQLAGQLRAKVTRMAAQLQAAQIRHLEVTSANSLHVIAGTLLLWRCRAASL